MNSLFDVLLDCPYRSTWDDHMVEGDDLYKIDHNNDIGYYAGNTYRFKSYLIYFRSRLLFDSYLCDCSC